MEGLENQSLGKYDIIRQIGRGNMGTVYLGMDTFAGRNVAIKVANPDSSKPEKLARRHRKLFFNEAKASGLLRHPNIVASTTQVLRRISATSSWSTSPTTAPLSSACLKI